MKFKTISIVIPVYNEENLVTKALQRVIKSDTCGLKKEIIIINDGSTDRTLTKIKDSFDIAQDKSAQDKQKLILINKKKNEGKGAALKIGFKKSTGDLVVVQDADLEYNPEDYPALIEPFIKYNADAVFGSRFISAQPHRILYFWHAFGNRFLTFLSNMLSNFNLTDVAAGYKVFRGDLIRKIAPKLKVKGFGFDPEITARLAKIKNIKLYEVGISYQGRTYEEGKKINWIDGIKAIIQTLYFNLKID